MPIYCITGANRGLGLEFVRQLALSPDNVILATTRPDTDVSDLQTTVAASASPENAHLLTCDTSSVPSIHTFAVQVRRLLAGRHIDFLINNAGINGTSAGENSLSLNHTHFAEQITVNVVGTAKVVEFLFDQHLLAPAVRVLNMSSGQGSMAVNLSQEPRITIGYSMSKAALNMLTVHQASDLRRTLPEAVVACIHPGWVKTRMGGEGAILEPEVSIAGMLKVLHSLTKEDNAKFLCYDGSVMPW